MALAVILVICNVCGDVMNVPQGLGRTELTRAIKREDREVEDVDIMGHHMHGDDLLHIEMIVVASAAIIVMTLAIMWRGFI